MTRELPIGHGRMALVDDSDYEAVILAGAWRIFIPPNRRTAYVRRNVRLESGQRTTQSLHRFLLPDVPIVDHINGDGLDNRRVNLRPATSQQNAANRRKQSNNKSGYKGVTQSKSKTRWSARIIVNQKFIGLGSYGSPIEAARAYDLAALHHFGEYARTNFPRGSAA